jgi:hypothetical protein
VQNTVRDWKVLPGFIAVGTVIYLITLLTAAAHERGLAVQPWIINEEADLNVSWRWTWTASTPITPIGCWS